MLKHLVEFGYPIGHFIIAGTYLIFYHHRNQDKKKARYLSFVQKHLDQLDQQDLLVYQRVRSKINPFTAKLFVLDIAGH